MIPYIKRTEEQQRQEEEARQKVLQTAPRARDKYGNPIIKVGHYWCSFDYNRLMQLVRESAPDEVIIVVRLSDKHFFSRNRRCFLMGKAAWCKRIRSQWYLFVDPEVQEVGL